MSLSIRWNCLLITSSAQIRGTLNLDLQMQIILILKTFLIVSLLHSPHIIIYAVLLIMKFLLACFDSSLGTLFRQSALHLAV